MGLFFFFFLQQVTYIAILKGLGDPPDFRPEVECWQCLLPFSPQEDTGLIWVWPLLGLEP